MVKTKKSQTSLAKIIASVPNIKSRKTVDVFAREGNWQTIIFSNKVKSLDAWEIDPAFAKKLKENVPNANVSCHDSIAFINEEKYTNKYDLIVLDNGLNCYGPDRTFCEHFDFFDKVYKMAEDDVFLIVNVLAIPNNLDGFSDWKERRSNFYKLDDTTNLSQDFIKSFYQAKIEAQGFEVEHLNLYDRTENGINHLFYLSVKATRKSS